MDIKPVKTTDKPKYPLKDEISVGTLKSSVPVRWTHSAAAKAALGALAAMTLVGCVPEMQTAGVPVAPSITSENNYNLTETPIVDGTPMGKFMIEKINVAPLFLHGEGRGAFGCVMVAPPVFLSEDDALAVINETAKEYGLKFTAGDGPEFTGVTQPVTSLYGEETGPSDKTTTLKPDFTDSEHGVVIEYVSVEDVRKWHKETGYAVSVEEYDTEDVADQLSDGLEQADNNGFYTAGVLYDPCERCEPEDPSNEEEWNKAEAKTRQMSEEQLKAQAKDFFEWLKTQGII